MIIIAALGSNRVIGRRGGLPWNVPSEYQKFLGFVSGNVVIMGRRSYEIFGRDLEESRLVVVSSSVKELPDAEVCPDIGSAVARANSYGRPVFCAGGASIYSQTLPLAAAMYLSFMKGQFSGDTYFPEFDENDWKITKIEDHPLFEFRIYRRRR